jgi:hypothetical protein
VGGRPGERDVVRDFFVDLEQLRVLSWPFEMEGETYTNSSVLRIREEATKALKAAPDGSRSKACLRGVVGACNDYLTDAQWPEPRPLRPAYRRALRRWRQAIRVELQEMARGLDLDEGRRIVAAMPT